MNPQQIPNDTNRINLETNHNGVQMIIKREQTDYTKDVEIFNFEPITCEMVQEQNNNVKHEPARRKTLFGCYICHKTFFKIKHLNKHKKFQHNANGNVLKDSNRHDSKRLEAPSRNGNFEQNPPNVVKVKSEITKMATIEEKCRRNIVPYTVVKNKINKKRQKKVKNKHLLTPQEEDVLIKWINTMAEHGLSFNEKQLREKAANAMKKNRSTPEIKTPNYYWVLNFLKRHPETVRHYTACTNISKNWECVPDLEENLMPVDLPVVPDVPGIILDLDEPECKTSLVPGIELDKPAEITTENLLYFESLIPSERISEFRAVENEEIWKGDESAKELFYVWREIRSRAVVDCILGI